jgi:hypothetical protein
MRQKEMKRYNTDKETEEKEKIHTTYSTLKDAYVGDLWQTDDEGHRIYTGPY